MRKTKNHMAGWISAKIKLGVASFFDHILSKFIILEAQMKSIQIPSLSMWFNANARSANCPKLHIEIG